MSIQITINVSSPEELAAVAAKLAGQPATFNQAPIQPSVQPSAQQAPVTPLHPPVGATGQAPTSQAPIDQAPPAPTNQAPTGQAPVSTAPSYTAQQLGVAAQPLVDAGRAGELIAWLNQRGAGALTQLDPSHYGDFATYLRSLGCKI